MLSELVYLGTTILGIVTVTYFLVSNITGKKSEAYVLSNLLFLKTEDRSKSDL